MNKPSEAIAEATNPASDDLSIEALIAQRTRQMTATEETPEQAEPEETEEEPEEIAPEETPEAAEDETESEEEAETEETEDDGQVIDLLELSPEDIQQLAKKGKSRLLHRIGELTAQKRALEEKLNQTPADAKPLPEPIPDNPFKELKSLEEVSAKFKELEKVADETDRILEDHEDYAADDVITLGDKEFTKKEIRAANRNARNAMVKFLPAQAAAIQKSGQLAAMEEQFTAAIPKEIPEMADTESPLAKQYQAMIADPLVKQVRERVPDLAPQLGYILAHAARSIHSLKAKPKTPAAALKTQAKPPASPLGAAGARSGAPPVRKAIEQARARYEQSGSLADYQALRLAEMNT